MNHLKYLEFQRLMKELQFVESDYEYQNEIIRIKDSDFLNSVTDFLNNYPELQEIYNNKKIKIDLIGDVQSNYNKEEELREELKEEIPEVKSLYRNIVKSTHPDKVDNKHLNNLYKQATEAYENNDLITLYKVSSELDINIELNEDLINQIINKIDLLKSQTKMLESTFTFKWIKSNNQNERNQIILEFIKSQLI